MNTFLPRLENTNTCFPGNTFYIIYTIHPCCRLDRSYNGQNTTVVGWGKLSEGGDPADVLMEVTVPVITQKKCRRHTRSTIELDTHLCEIFTIVPQVPVE